MGGGKLEIGQLGNAIDKLGDLFTESLGDLGIRGLGVFDGVVKEGGRDGRVIHLLLGEDHRHGNRMGEIGLARMAELALMHGFAKGVGLAQELFVRAGVVGADQRDQFVGGRHLVLAFGGAGTGRLALPLSFHQRPQQFLFRHIVFDGLVGLGTHEKGHGVVFRLVDLDLGLVGFDHPLTEVTGKLGLVGNFAQGDDGVLVIVAGNGQRSARGDLAGTMRGEHHKLEPVRYLVYAIFDGYAGH